MTPHGFIEESPNALSAYKKSRQEEWANILGGADFKLVGEEESQETYVNAFTEEPS
jgi:hypothetical protein